jgi:hypothetical protein
LGTYYQATIEIRCWKEHTCVGCNGTFAYLFTRQIGAQGGTPEAANEAARQNALNTIQREVDPQPCPHCGLFQPEMVAHTRTPTYWTVFWVFTVVLAAVLICYLADLFRTDMLTWVLGGSAGLATIVCYLIELRNPNADLEGNKRRAAPLLESGLLQPGEAGSGERVEERIRNPRRSPLHQLILTLLPILTGVILLPELAGLVLHWPDNPRWYPGVVGPGDEAYIYFPNRHNSVKGYWAGTPTVKAHVLDGGNQAEFPVPATAKQDSWGTTIRVKSSEKSGSFLPWVRVTIPDRPELAGKQLETDIQLQVTYPALVGDSFQPTTETIPLKSRLQLGPAHAGRLYTNCWWIGLAAGGGVALLILGLLGQMSALRGRALPTKVFAAEEA